MTIPTFEPLMPPQLGSGLDLDEKTLETGFGENYAQITPDGLNSIFEARQLNWNGLTDAARDYNLAFFRQVGKSQPFFYQPPDAVEVKLYRFTSAMHVDSKARDSMSVSIVEDFSLTS